MIEVRDRLLDAAEKLIYRHGVHGVGIDTILAEAGAAKMSLYKHFDGKEALVVAMLERRHDVWMQWFMERTGELGKRAGGPVPAMFDALSEWFARRDFHGCAFINCASEFPDARHPVRLVSRRHKTSLKAAVGDICRKAGVDPALAPALYLLIEGAIVAAMVGSEPDAARAAKRTALRLISET
jgi:AcrR family transcriptional regulator